jgi:hypothetical protein
MSDAIDQGLRTFTAANKGQFWLSFFNIRQALDLAFKRDIESACLLFAIDRLLTLVSQGPNGRKCITCETTVTPDLENLGQIAIVHGNAPGTTAVGLVICPECAARGDGEMHARTIAELRTVWPDLTSKYVHPVGGRA